MVRKLDNQEKNKPLRNEKGQILPGFSGNPAGRPKGQTLKEYQAQKFRDMSEEEKDEFLKDVAKELRWRMSEGNPKTDADIDVRGSLVISFDNSFNETK
jgi:hypothetical protein